MADAFQWKSGEIDETGIMANFISVYDSDSERRNGFIEKVKPLLPPYDGLTISECSSGSFTSVWAAGDRAPVTSSSDEKGCAVIWGDAIYPGSNRRANAAELRGKWTNPHKRDNPFFSGYYGAIVYNPSCGLLAGADLLGIFPVYYYTAKDVLLVGSSPELFRHHRAFTSEFDPAGLVGILLTMHLINGQTLLKGVKRLSAGHLLCWQPGNEAVEVKQYEFPVSNRYFSLPFSAHVDLLDEAIEDALRRHVSEGEQHNLLLSGGMDSRMLAGYMGEMGLPPFALTFGVKADQEAQCAKKVARFLHLKHRIVEIPYEWYSACASKRTNLEHIASGFSELVEWGVPEYLKDIQPRVVMGHSLDAVIGTRYMNWAYDPESKTMSFESYFRNINRYGFSPDILRRLLKREVFGDLVEQTIAEIKIMYESFSDMESQRAWCFNLYNRQRFHVGNGAFPLSFRSWPVIPALDYELLSCAGSMPASTIAERRAQIALMSSRFPELSALSLDRNSQNNTEPLRPRLRHQIRRALVARLPWRNRRNRDDRYYARIYDLNNSGWQAVRREAEPYREKISGIMDLNMLHELLPAPDKALQLNDGFVDGSGRKLLVALLLWTRDHL